MQSSTISVTFDDFDDLTIGPVDYELFRSLSEKSSSIYRTTAETAASLDRLQLYVTDPKPSGNFLGQMKSALKFTRGHQVVDALNNVIIRNSIIEIKVSVPVGIGEADFHDFVQMPAQILLQHDVMNKLSRKQEY